MKRGDIEPGLLPTFRAFVGLQLVLLVLLTYSDLVPSRVRIGLLGLRIRPGLLRPAADGLQVSSIVLLLLGLVCLSLLMAYLSAPALGRRLRGTYLPVALAVNVVLLLLGHHLLSRGMASAAGSSGLVVRSWQLFLLLFVPLILTAWQYSFSIVITFCGLAGVLDLLFTLPLLRSGATGAGLYSLLLLFRTAAFLLVGFLVTRVLHIQRSLRADLAQAHARLVRYAADLDDLATMRERNRLARELHDTLAHALSGLAVQLEAAVTQWDSRPAEARRRVEDSLQTARAGLTEARRAIKDLRASALDELGLRRALQALAERATGRAAIALDLQIPETDPRLSPAVEHGIYRIADEAISNAIEHAHPTRLTVRLAAHEGGVELVVEDDGRSPVSPGAAEADGHFGIRGMRERADLIGAGLEVGRAPAGGTRVVLRVKEEA